MKTRLTILLVLAGLHCFAQSTALRVVPANITNEIVVDDLDRDYRHVTNLTVTNTTGRVLNVNPVQSTPRKPLGWRYDIVASDAEGADEPIRLGPGESAEVRLVLNNGGRTGDGIVEIDFLDSTAPDDVPLGSASFTTRIVRRDGNRGASLSRPDPTKVSLYPNPARDRFFVEVPGGTEVGRVDVINTLGKRLLRFDQPAGREGYNIEGLPDGMYLVSIYDARGKKLKTLRLLHRRFGA